MQVNIEQIHIGWIAVLYVMIVLETYIHEKLHGGKWIEIDLVPPFEGRSFAKHWKDFLFPTWLPAIFSLVVAFLIFKNNVNNVYLFLYGAVSFYSFLCESILGPINNILNNNHGSSDLRMPIWIIVGAITLLYMFNFYVIGFLKVLGIKVLM